MKPVHRFVLVSGLPASGKTTLARALSGRLGWPAIAAESQARLGPLRPQQAIDWPTDSPASEQALDHLATRIEEWATASKGTP